MYTHSTSSNQREITENGMNSSLERIFSDRNLSGDETWKYCNHASPNNHECPLARMHAIDTST